MGYTANDIRNICLLGHGGDGKSALCESMLFTTKAITRLGKRDPDAASKQLDGLRDKLRALEERLLVLEARDPQRSGEPS